MAPVFPVGPVDPFKPVGPVTPVAPVLPVCPVCPVDPVGPVGPVMPVVPTSPLSPVAAIHTSTGSALLNTAPESPEANETSNVHQVPLSIPPEMVNSNKVVGVAVKASLMYPRIVDGCGLLTTLDRNAPMLFACVSVSLMYTCVALSWVVALLRRTFPLPGSALVVVESNR